MIAISSCFDWEKNGNNQVLRDTWLPSNFIGLDYRFFVGHGQGAESAEKLPADLAFLPDVEDDYGHLSTKTQASLRWALERDYDFVFRCFPDTYCRPERLVSCGFEAYDYYGDFRGEHCGPDNYPSGGPGYWTSRRVNELLVDAPITGVWRDDITPYAEDLWGGKILARHRNIGLRYFDNPNFINRGTQGAGPMKNNSIISTHLSCPDRYYPERMQHKHAEWMASQ